MHVPTLRAVPVLLALALAGSLLGPAAFAGPTTTCGDGVVEGPEYCDDGNTVDGDGCSSACFYEICGDGVVDAANEDCDTGALCEDDTTDCTEVSVPGTPGGPNDPGGLCSVDCAPRTDVGDGCDDTCQFECGNGILNVGEECDDGNRDAGDGCDEMCVVEICGNGVVQVGEQCDEGAFCEDGSPCDINDTAACTGIGTETCVANADSATCDETCTLIDLNPLDKDQQKCVTTVNKSGSNIAKAQNKEGLKCVKDKQKGKVADYDACLIGDTRGKIQKQIDKLNKKATKKCNPADLPTFGYIGDLPAVSMVATSHPVAVLQSIFGDPGDGAIVSKSVDKNGAKCQLDVVKRSTKLYDTIMKEYDKAKKQALKGSKKVTAVTNQVELSNTLMNVTATSPKIQKKSEQLNEKPAKKCAGVDPATTFPGDCTNADLSLVLQCITQRVACESCLQINEEDGLVIDCDLVDDDVANASCM